MSRRTNPQLVGQRVADAITNGGAEIATVAEAADMAVPDLIARLNGMCDFTVKELVRVGGFLRIHPSGLLPGGTT